MNRNQLINAPNNIFENIFSEMCSDHLIEKLSQDSNLYQNSVILSLPPPGLSKTAHSLKKMLMIAETQDPQNPIVQKIFHVTNKDLDKTFDKVAALIEQTFLLQKLLILNYMKILRNSLNLKCKITK